MGLLSEGRDTYCLDGLITGRMATGKTLLAQRLYHRLTTPTGALRGGEDEADFGIDLAEYVGALDTSAVDATLRAKVINELRKDPGVDAVDCVPTRTEAGGLVSWSLTISVTSTLGDIQLIVSVSSLSVDLLGVR